MGCFWNCGNIFRCAYVLYDYLYFLFVRSIYATKDLGQAVGFSLTQCALLISGLWAIIYFKELTYRNAIIIWVLAAFVLLGGAFLLAFKAR
jgi:glucose uptake protein GlcU